eukprot:scaffold282886_cov17-Tisochrysis_lutea.AAC.1
MPVGNSFGLVGACVWKERLRIPGCCGAVAAAGVMRGPGLLCWCDEGPRAAVKGAGVVLMCFSLNRQKC